MTNAIYIKITENYLHINWPIKLLFTCVNKIYAIYITITAINQYNTYHI